MRRKTRIVLVGKYIELPDAYISVAEALKHAGFDFNSDIEIGWVGSQELTAENIAGRTGSADDILVPGGFGNRGVEEKIRAIRFARENDVPFLDICLGMQMTCVEFSRNIVGLEDAGSAETNPDVTNNIIDLMTDQEDVRNSDGTLHLGLYPCKLKEGTRTAAAYGNEDAVQERHRHRYEFGNKCRQLFEKNGLVFSEVSPDDRLVEIVEVSEKQFFVACQFRPELASRSNRPQRLIKGFVGVTLANKESK